MPYFIPVLGYLDDAILLPLGILLVIRVMPLNVLDECRKHVEMGGKQGIKAGY
nr:DUF1232 domain-containing protein [Pseudomonas fluorescens]